MPSHVAERLDTWPQCQRWTKSRCATTKNDQRPPLRFASEIGKVAHDLLEPMPHRRNQRSQVEQREALGRPDIAEKPADVTLAISAGRRIGVVPQRRALVGPGRVGLPPLRPRLHSSVAGDLDRGGDVVRKGSVRPWLRSTSRCAGSGPGTFSRDRDRDRRRGCASFLVELHLRAYAYRRHIACPRRDLTDRCSVRRTQGREEAQRGVQTEDEDRRLTYPRSRVVMSSAAFGQYRKRAVSSACCCGRRYRPSESAPSRLVRAFVAVDGYTTPDDVSTDCGRRWPTCPSAWFPLRRRKR